MAKQKTDWGEINWLEEKANQGLQTGIVTLLPNGHQPKHIHYEEQVIYVLEGQALSVIDGIKTCLKVGDMAHWQAGVEHEIFNRGEGEFRHLLISNPGQEDKFSFFPDQEVDVEIAPNLIYLAVEAIRTQFLESLPYGYVIFDSLGNLMIQSSYMPDFCQRCCQVKENQGKAYCMHQLSREKRGEEAVFQCPLGMEVFHYPIYFQKNFLGYIQGGYIRHASRTGGILIQEVYDVPESVVLGIKALMRRILKAIRNYCEFEQFRKTLMEKELRISANEEIKEKLMQNLQETQLAVTDLKINHHFLFNTLNSMASMALDCDVMPLYQSIIDLSKMFHYSLQTQSSMVLFYKEVDYVKAYLQLQKLRYGDELDILMEIARESRQAMVPFNFLQPVVENAFVHGFRYDRKKQIKIQAAIGEQRLAIKVINSGHRMTEEMLRRVNYGIHSNTGHGLSMVCHKIQTFFKEDFTFEVSSLSNGDTCFSIIIPFFAGEERRYL